MMAGTAEGDAGERPAPGRPRDPHADEAIVDAAAGVLADCGPSGFTVDAVAARAGVGKATIYRRWPSKLDLLLSVSERAAFELADPDTGSVRDDFVIHLTQLAGKLRNTMAGRVLPAIVAEAAGNAEMRDVVARLFEQRRAMARGMLARGVARGELPEDTDLDLLLDLLAGPIFVRILLTQMPVDETTVERIVDSALCGLGT